MIPGIGDLCDIANMVWYLKEGNIKMAGACALSALPMLGTVVGGTLNICKLPKAARYVKTIACCVGYGYTAFVATDAAINYGKEAYQSYKETGFSKETSKAVAGLTFSLTCAVLSGKATADNLSSAVKMLSVDTKNAWSRLKNSNLRLNNYGFVDLRGKGTLEKLESGYKSGSGSVTYGELDSLGRTTGIEATITPDMIGAGSPAKSSIKPAGFGGQAQGHARGHLLGNQLGGSGNDPRNLVTIYQNPVNHPVMSSIEANVRRAVDGGQIVNYNVTPIYEGNNLIPCGITIQAQGSGGLNIYQTLLNRK